MPRAGTPQQTVSIHSLPPELLRDIFSRVTQAAGADAWRELPLSTSFSRRKLQDDAQWRARRVCAQVCKLFEALTYDGAQSTHHHLGARDTLPRAAPLGFATRELERAALSSSLTRLEFFLPRNRALSTSDAWELAAAAAVLRHCTSLDTVRIFIRPAPQYDLVYMHEELTSALRSVQSLRSLTLASYDTAGRWPSLGALASQRLAGVLAALTALTALDFLGFELRQGELAADLPELTSLRSLRLWDVNFSDAWLDFLMAQHLTCFNSDDVQHFGGRALANLRPSLKALCICGHELNAAEQLRVTQVLQTLTQVSHICIGDMAWSDAAVAALGRVLVDMPSLQSLSLWRMSLEHESMYRLFEQLPKCAHLTRLELSSHEDVGKRWASAAGAAIAACSALHELIMQRVKVLADEPDALCALFDVLPKCAKLASVEVRDISLGLPAASALLVNARACPSLRELALTAHGMSAEGRKEVEALAQPLSVDFEFS